MQIKLISLPADQMVRGYPLIWARLGNISRTFSTLLATETEIHGVVYFTVAKVNRLHRRYLSADNYEKRGKKVTRFIRRVCVHF